MRIDKKITLRLDKKELIPLIESYLASIGYRAKPNGIRFRASCSDPYSKNGCVGADFDEVEIDAEEIKR